MVTRLVAEEINASVIDKDYFRIVEAVKSAPNLDLMGQKPLRYNAGDKLIELHTVFLSIPQLTFGKRRFSREHN
jgi:hypothetical protein